ncbi:TPA: hypothetical protein ACYFU0_000788 [Klebsiella pneumoniae]|nr:hypothetical protein [Klebsiella michiganensis]
MKITEARRNALLREAIKNIEEIKAIQSFIDAELMALTKKAA